MDRMYDGLDGSVWMSFPSADRNKVDEDTYLILKKGNGENNFLSDGKAKPSVDLTCIKFATRLACERQTPLGNPVVPELYGNK